MNNREFESFNDIINGMKLTILEHGYLEAGIDWQFYELSSPFNRMYFVLDGKGSIYNNMNQVPIKGGQVYIVPLGQTFNYVCDESLLMFYIHFRIESIAGQDLFEGYKYCVQHPMSVLEIQQLVHLAKNSSVSDLLTCKGIFYQHIGSFVKPFSQELIEHVKLVGQNRTINEYVKEHLSATLKIQDIAKHLRMNPSTLSKGFKKSAGMTLKNYIDGKMIQKAQEHLLISEKHIKDIAFHLQFSDEFHFSRYFKRHTGISPSVYRQRSNHYK